MKCTVCRGPAQISIPRHNTKFCTPHFIEHIHRQTERSIEKYRMFGKEEPLLLAVSGGKDSMAAWHILGSLGYRVEALHFDNGFGDFSAESRRAVEDFAGRHDLPLRVFSFKELVGYDFETVLSHTHMPPCSLCGTSKRYHLNKIALDGGYAAVLTGHNLDDETSFLLGNLLHGQEEYIRKQYPVLPAEPGMARKAKPLVRLTDRDLRLYAEVNEVSYCSLECPHATDVRSHFHKELMHEADTHSPGVKGSFYFGFIDKIHPDIVVPREEREIHHCRRCGAQTTKAELCLMCELIEKVESGERK
jgi:tRNA(Ile)-lysidine synthase TilS/MesJ